MGRQIMPAQSHQRKIKNPQVISLNQLIWLFYLDVSPAGLLWSFVCYLTRLGFSVREHEVFSNPPCPGVYLTPTIRSAI
jgi:hypothetical protein